jgi:hypothetical protein
MNNINGCDLMSNKNKMDVFKKDKDKWEKEKKSKIDTNDSLNRTLYGSPTIGGIIIFLIILGIIIYGIFIK